MNAIHFVTKTRIRVCMLFLALQMITTTVAAQELAVDWDQTRSGLFTPIENQMAVDASTGTQYVLELSEGTEPAWILDKLDPDGDLTWSLTPLNRFDNAISMLYRDGAVYILAQRKNAMLVIKVNDLGGTGVIAPGEPTLIQPSFGSCSVLCMIADPTEDGVIISAKFSFDNPDYRGFYSTMETRRVSAAGVVTEFEDLDLDATGADPFVGPRAFCADEAGNVYATGASHATAPVTDHDYMGPSRRFVVKFDRMGNIVWHDEPNEPGMTNVGYDIEVDATGVYILGQKAAEHSRVSGPPITGNSTLTKYTLSGIHVRTIEIPSRIRYDATNVIKRDALVLDRTSSSLFVAYDKVAPSEVGLNKYNTNLDLQRTRTISSGAPIAIGGLIPGPNNTIEISTVNESASLIGIHAFEGSGRFIDDLFLTGNSIPHMIPDALGNIHVICNRPTTYVKSSIFFIPRYPIIPEYVGRLEDFKLKLFEEIHPEWDKLEVDWSCFTPDCFGPDFISTLTANGKVTWQSSFSKPTTLLLPATQEFNSFTLSGKASQGYSEVLRVDERLAQNGVKSLEVSSESDTQSLSISIDTDGAQVPVILSMLNKDGKLLGDQKLVAPINKTFNDKFNEPVASLSITGPPAPLSVSFYPNPSSGQFTLTLGAQVKLPATLTIYDGQGVKAHSQSLKALNENISLPSPKPGLYLLKVISNLGTETATLQIKN